MNRFFAIVPLMLSAAMSQAAPTVTEANSQSQALTPPEEVVLPDAETLVPPVPQIPTVQIQSPPTAAAAAPPPPPPPQPRPKSPPPPQTSQCRTDLPQCPATCEPSKPSTSSADNEKAPEKKTGWANGFSRAFRYCDTAFYETSVEKDGIGILTNLVYKIGDARPKKKQNSEGKGKGSVKACCIFYGSPPPVKDDEGDEDKGAPMNIQIPPITCNWIRSHNQSTVPGVPAVTPAVPGAKARITEPSLD